MMGRRRSRGDDEAEVAVDTPAPPSSTGRGMVDLVSQFGRRGHGSAGDTEAFEEWVELPSYRPSFGALLVRAGIASDGDVKEALAEGMRTGERLGEVVIRKGWATEERIAQVLAEQWQLPFVEAHEAAVDPGALQRVPLAVAQELGALPIGFDGTTVVLAIAEPNEDLFAAVKSRVGDASFVVVAHSVLEPLIATLSEPSAVSQAIEPAFVEPDDPYSLPEPAPAPAPSLRDEAVAVEAPREWESAHPSSFSGNQEETGEVAALIDTIDSASRDLDRVRGEVEALGAALARAKTQLGEYESALAAATEARDRDSATIRRLEAELSQRDGIFEALKGQIATLNRTLDEPAPGWSDGPSHMG